MEIKKPILCCLAAVLALLAGAVISSASEAETVLPLQPVGDAQRPEKTLKLAVAVTDVYCKDSSCKCIEQIATRGYGDFCRKLKEKYNIELELTYFVEPYDIARAFIDGKFDALLCKPWIVYQHPQGRSEQMARVADLQDLKGNPGLWGIVIVPKESPIRELSEIAGKRLAIGQPDAYEKHQAALALFKQEKIKVAENKMVQKASCLECLDLLMKGQADAAVISNYALTADCAVDVTSPDAFRVLGKTEQIPLTSFMVDLGRVSRDDARRIGQALIELTTSELPDTMSGGGFVTPASWKVQRGTP